MKILLLLTLLLGFSVPAIAHNEFNGGDAMHCGHNHCWNEVEGEEGEGADVDKGWQRYGYK